MAKLWTATTDWSCGRLYQQAIINPSISTAIPESCNLSTSSSDAFDIGTPAVFARAVFHPSPLTTHDNALSTFTSHHTPDDKMRFVYLLTLLASVVSLQPAAAFYKVADGCPQCLKKCPIPNHRPYWWSDVCMYCMRTTPCRQVYVEAVRKSLCPSLPPFALVIHNINMSELTLDDKGLLPKYMGTGGARLERTPYIPESGLKPIDGSPPQ